MGRNNKEEHLEGLLVQKDQEAYIARTSILQSRLLSTLDTLDVIQSSQNNELDAMAQTNRRLKDKLVRYSAIVRSAESERDDMRDAVLKLVEKVELSNDYSMWPHSQIRLSSLAGGSVFLNSVVQPSEPDLLLHATTMIEILCRDRDLERKAHAQTRDLAQARLVSLAAQLSRREAELEGFISGTAHPVSTVPLEHPRHAQQSIGESLTSEQIISALDATLTRNKTLEIEIEGVFKRLEDARLAASSSGPPPPLFNSLQQWHEMQQSLIPITAATPPHNPTLQKVQSQSLLGVPGETTPTLEHPQPNGADRTPVFPDPNYKAIQDLEREIRTLGAKVDAFAEARRSLTQTVRTDVHSEDASCLLESRLEILESENCLLRVSNRRLRDELDTAHINAQARESELLIEIQSLRSNQQAVFEDNDVDNLLETDSGEISMELATPLLPTRVMLDVNNAVSSVTPYADPLSIPLPPSPDNHPSSISPALSQIILSDGNVHHERPD